MPLNQPAVSVVIPARNAAATLPAAVDSILTQSLSDFELILLDHKSSDGTHDLMRKYAAKDPRVKVATCRGSFIEAVNRAWEISGGDLIARMDADDVSRPSRLEKQRDFLLQHPDIACCASRVKIQKRDPVSGKVSPPDKGYAEYEKWINSLLSPDQIVRERFIDSPLPNPATMIRRDILEELRGYHDLPWAEDYDLWLRLIENGSSAGKVDDVLLDWYDGNTRATRNQERYSQENFQRAKAHFLARIPEVKRNGVAICGAGPIGKNMARFLTAEKVKVHAFYEVNERQIGNQISGIPVKNSLDMGKFTAKCVLIAAVGLRGAREKIRELAKKTGYTEGLNFFCTA